MGCMLRAGAFGGRSLEVVRTPTLSSIGLPWGQDEPPVPPHHVRYGELRKAALEGSALEELLQHLVEEHPASLKAQSRRFACKNASALAVGI